MKLLLILSVISSFFPVPQVFANRMNGQKHKNIFSIEDLDDSVIQKIASKLATKDRINMGGASKYLNALTNDYNHRICMKDGSVKRFEDLEAEDFTMIGHFNDIFYLGLKYVDTSAPLQMWALGQCLTGICEFNMSDKKNDKITNIDVKFYQDLLALEPSDNNGNRSLQEKLGHLSIHLVLNIVSNISRQEHSSEAKSTALFAFYQNFLDMGFIDAIEPEPIAQDRLAHILINLYLWHQVWTESWAQVNLHVEAKLGHLVLDHIEPQVDFQIRAQVGAHLSKHLRDQIAFQIWEQVESQAGFQFGAQIWDQVISEVRTIVGSQFSSRVEKYLSEFSILSAFDEDKLKEDLKPAIDSVLIPKQVLMIYWQNTSEFHEIKRAVSESISAMMTTEQIESILNSIVIPSSELPLVNTFCEVLRKPSKHSKHSKTKLSF